MRVLIYDPFVLWYHHFVTSLEIGLDHLNKGDVVHFLSCDSSLSYCDTVTPPSMPSVNARSLPYCTLCHAHKNKGLDLINLPLKNRHKLDLKKFKRKFDIPDFNTIEDLMNFKIDGIDCGMGLASSLVSAFRETHPDFSNSRIFLRNAMVDSMAVYECIKHYLIKLRVDFFYIFNGRFHTTRPALRAAQELGIKVYCHERGGVLNRYFLAEDSYVHQIGLIIKDMDIVWQNNPSTENKVQIAREFFSNRIKGKEMSWYSFLKAQEINRLPENFDKSKRNIAIFNSSDEEFSAIDNEWKDTAFKNQNETIAKIAKSFINEKNIHFYLRVHPNLKNLNNTQTKEINNLNYSNLTVIEPDAAIDSYALMGACEKVITLGSTIGIESTYYGKASILLARAWHEQLNVCYVPQKFEEAIELINDINLPALPEEGAIIYGYWEMQKGQEYKFYKPEQISGGKLLDVYIDFEIKNQKELIEIVNDFFTSTFADIKPNQEPLVSIIMPACNASETIKESVRSLINQSYSNWELIIVDNGSTDDTAQIIRELIIKDKRISYFYLDKKNIASARNKAISHSKGRFLMFHDSGNFLFPYAIEALVKSIISQPGVKLAYGDYFVFDSTNYIYQNMRNASEKSELYRQQLIGNLIETGTVLMERGADPQKLVVNNIKTGTVLLERTAAIDCGLFDGRLSVQEDFDLWNRIIQKYPVIKVALPVYLNVQDGTEKLSKNIERQRYFTDIACIKLIKNVGALNLFTDLTIEPSQIAEYTNLLVQNILERFDTPIDTAIYLLQQAQNIDFSIERKNKITDITGINNKKVFAALDDYFKQPSQSFDLSAAFFNSANKRRLSKIFVNDQDSFFREYYTDRDFYFSNEQGHLFLYFSCSFNLPDELLDFIYSNIDQLWVPSSFIKSLLSESGTDDDRIFVIPVPVDTSLFNPETVPLNIAPGKFRFLYTGSITFLSGIELLVDAFLEEFTDDAVLIIKSNGIYDMDIKIKESANIIFIDENYSDIEFASLYTGADCFVYPHKADPDGETVLKAMSSELAVITSKAGAAVDFATEENAWLINVMRVEDKTKKIEGTSGGLIYFEPDKEHLKQLMKEVYNNQNEAKAKAVKARQKVISAYSTVSVNKIIEYSQSKILDTPVLRDNFKDTVDELLEKGLKLFKLKKYKAAEKVFFKLSLYDKKNIDYYYNSGLCQFIQGKYESAVDSFTSALKLGMVNYEICQYLAQSLEKTGDKKTANLFYEKSLSLK